MKAKVGVYVCECGPNLAEKLDLDRIIETISGLEEYVDVELVVKKFGLLCSLDGKAYLEEEIESNSLTHLVLGSCSPRDHNKTFIEVCKKTSLNPYLYKIINIREHCAWVIPDKEEATDKAISYLRAGINRVLFQSALIEKRLDIDPDVLVVGGGIAGMQSALSLASEERRVYLIEKSGMLGGRTVRLGGTLKRQGSETGPIRSIVEQVEKNNNIKVYLDSTLGSVIGFLGNFEVAVTRSGGESSDLKVGAIVVATGAALADPASVPGIEFSEGDEVFTSAEVEEMFAKKGKVEKRGGGQPASVALVHCVGRGGKGYCSRICCNYLVKIAGYLRQQSGEIEITHFHKGLCLPDKADQSAQRKVAGQGVDFIRTMETSVSGTKVAYTGMDEKKQDMQFDMVILAPAIEAGSDTERLADLLGVPISETGFFQEIHQTTDPVATATEGVFVVGSAHSPRGIDDSIIMSKASAGKILTQLIPGEKITPEVKVSEILEAYCTGCKNCLDVCVYGAIEYDDARGISVVNEVVCRGCGNCFGSCPSGALRTKHFTNTQLYREMREAIR